MKQEKVFIAPIPVETAFKEAINMLAEQRGLNIATLVRLLLIREIQAEKIAKKSKTKTWKK